MEAAASCTRDGVEVSCDVMIPLVGIAQELKHQASIFRKVAEEVKDDTGQDFDVRVGTMIEVSMQGIKMDGVPV